MQIHLGFPSVREAKVSLRPLHWIYIWIRPQEDAGNDESILDALETEVGELSPMNSEEYEAAMKEYDEDLTAVDKPPAAQ